QRMKYQSYRRQSAPSLVLTKALTRSRTLSRESFQPPVCPESCSLVHSFLAGFDRAFLLHGHVQLRTGMQTQDRHLFLFTDVLVISKAKSANHFKQKAQVRVCQMWTAGYMDEVCEGSMSPERSFVMGWPTCNYVATFRSTEDKEKWLSRLKSRIREEKESEEPKTIPLRVYGKGINTFAVTKTLPVSNWDSTNEVVRLALQQFGIIGNVKDFQLWVISKKDNVPYPLIGHEFPFSIQMSHVIQSLSQRGEGRDAAAPPVHPQLALQMEQLQAYKHCQFILKPRPSEPPPLSSELPQKPLKRRRSFMGWAFWRGSSPHPDHPGLSTSRGCLFGQPLSRVCVEDALPRPVMDMLAFLY
uniref:Ras-associating domain-containing protein n=1 Tax=Tetraodon nigroviridis TaxID=99883 RepID=H3C3Q9_TETNG